LEEYEKNGCEKLILLGDILYHGPRNSLPKEYEPKKVISLLNSMKSDILAVRGNCEAEVDQMVLDFSVMSDSLIMFEKGVMFFVTHGHLFNIENPPKLNKNDILIHGHTHVQCVKKFGENIYINPGSVSLPKEGNPQSYMLYENGCFTISDFDKNVLNSYEINY
jgi:hypothetical protein